MKPQQLSTYLREGNDTALKRRRWVIGLSLLGMAVGQVITLYQTGIIRHLPDPPVGPFDADKVEASKYAYKRANMPDAPAMAVSYGITATLAAAGGPDRPKRAPWLVLALGAKVVYDAVIALRLAQEEWQENKALCPYCQTATLVSVASLPLVIPEAVEAVQQLSAKR